MMCDLRGLAGDDDSGRARVVKDLNSCGAEFLKRFPNPVSDLPAAKAVVKFLIEFIGKANILAVSPAYRQGDWFDKVATAAALHLEASCEGVKLWSEALDVNEGTHAIPLMTIHKSKGLEYHSVIFRRLGRRRVVEFRKRQARSDCWIFRGFHACKAARGILLLCPAGRSNKDRGPLRFAHEGWRQDTQNRLTSASAMEPLGMISALAAAAATLRRVIIRMKRFSASSWWDARAAVGLEGL
jgi:hypothetical protein